MFGMGVAELMILGALAVMLFGKRLPEVARSFGRSYQEFRAGLNEIKAEVDRATREAERPLYDRPAIGYDKTEDNDREEERTEQALADHESASSQS